MDIEQLIGSVLRGAVTGRGKTGRKAARYLTGGGSGSFLNASTLMTAAGLAWGVVESMRGDAAGSTAAGTAAGAPPAGPAAPPPIPGAPGAAAAPIVPPPLPGGPPPVPGRVVSHPGVPDGIARLLRIAISAARADGTLSVEEEARILAQARAAGAEGLVQAELRSPSPLEAVVAGVGADSERQELYAVAFTIVRADESVSGAERIYLAQLAHKLGLTATEVERVERETAARIDAADAESSDPTP